MIPNILSPEKIRELIEKSKDFVMSSKAFRNGEVDDILKSALHYADRVKELENELKANQRNRTKLFTWNNDELEVEIWRKD